MTRLHASMIAALALLAVSGETSRAQGSEPRYINPPGLSKPAGYTHVIVAADGRTVYVAGQVAYDSTGAIVGVGDFRAQAERAFANLRIALASAGATFADVVKTTTFLTDVKNVATLREVRSKYLDSTRLPTSTTVGVAQLVRPELMIEVEAVAVLRR